MYATQYDIDQLTAEYYARAKVKYGDALADAVPTIRIVDANVPQAFRTSLKQQVIQIANMVTQEESADYLRHEIAHYVVGSMTNEGCHRNVKGAFLTPAKVHNDEWQSLVDYLKGESVEEPEVAASDNVMYLEGARGAHAKGELHTSGFKVYAGSQVSDGVVDSFPKTYKELRQRLLSSNIIDPDTMRFTIDYVFRGPTPAASVVMGRVANGHIEWKKPNAAPSVTKNRVYHLTGARNANARGTVTDDGFVVYAGSKLAENPVKSFPKTYKEMRENLIASGIIDAETMEFAVDCYFRGPTPAASVVMGRIANGWLEWKEVEVAE